MGIGEGLHEKVDERLEDPDLYFLAKYSHIEVTHRNMTKPLLALVEIEAKIRSLMAYGAEDVAKGMALIEAEDRPAARANAYIGMLREAGALDPIDDITYPEPERS